MPPELPQTLRVFISYARRDASAFAEELLAGLEAAGFDAFLDRHDITGGEDWEARLASLLSDADTVVYVVSPASVASERCAWELSRAESLAKRIIPVVAIDVAEADTPAQLRRLNYIFFSPGHSFGQALRLLSTALRTDISWIREHTRLAELAARWQADPKPERLLLGSELAAAKEWVAAWKAGAPQVTDAHRDFLRASEEAENARTSEERRKLEQIAAAQADREQAIRQRAKTARRAVVVASALGLLALFGSVQACRANRQLAATRVELEGQRSLLEQEQEANALKREQLREAQQALEALRHAQDALASARPGEADTGEPAPVRPAPPPPASGAPPSTAPASRAASVLREALRQTSIAQGWDTDIFWCAGPGEGANRANAERIRAILSEEQERQLAGATAANSLSFRVGRVRLRTLTEAVNARPGYQVRADVVRGEAGERTEAEALRRFMAAQGGMALDVQTSGMTTPYYLSIFLCGARAGA